MLVAGVGRDDKDDECFRLLLAAMALPGGSSINGGDAAEVLVVPTAAVAPDVAATRKEGVMGRDEERRRGERGRTGCGSVS